LAGTPLVAVAVAACATSMTVVGCSLAVTASLGGTTAGDRGSVRLLFINNTPDTVVFSAGTFDPLDEQSVPSLVQFGFAGSGLTLGPQSESAIGSLPCARVFSLGGSRLLALAEANDTGTALVPEASIEGARFFAESPDGSAAPMMDGSTLPFEADLGVDFSCGALLIVRFEINDVGPSAFRIDFEFVPSESTR